MGGGTLKVNRAVLHSAGTSFGQAADGVRQFGETAGPRLASTRSVIRPSSKRLRRSVARQMLAARDWRTWRQSHWIRLSAQW